MHLPATTMLPFHCWQPRARSKPVGFYGDKDQRQRDMVLANFKSGMRPIMVATDVAARGLDVKEVKAVINYDFPVQRGAGSSGSDDYSSDE